MEQWFQWLESRPWLVLGTAVFSAVTFVGTLLLVPVLLRRMPAEYFVGPSPPPSESRRLHPAIRWIARVLKNVLGLVLLSMGILMLFLPGQGVLTILLGIALLDFPGKRRLEKSIASRPRVRQSIDWLRQRKGRPPLRFDDDEVSPT
jgi:hypothetical protein